MKKYILGLVMSVLLVAPGCGDLVMAKTIVDNIKANVAEAAEATETATGAVEEVIGKPLLSEESADAGANIASKAEGVAAVGKSALETITPFLPEDKQPYGKLAIGILGAITGVAAGAADWFRRRKNAAVKTAVLTAEKLPGGGETLARVASSQGTAKDMQKSYEANASAGLVSVSVDGNSAPYSTS